MSLLKKHACYVCGKRRWWRMMLTKMLPGSIIPFCGYECYFWFVRPMLQAATRYFREWGARSFNAAIEIDEERAMDCREGKDVAPLAHPCKVTDYPRPPSVWVGKVSQ